VRPALTLLALAGGVLLAGFSRPRQTSGINGEWRGTSLCTDLERAPACHDEQVRYVFRSVGATPDSTHVVAEKLVNGAYESMGELDLARDRATGAWAAEFRSQRGDLARWTFAVRGDSLAGSLVSLPDGARIRVVSARRK